MSDDVRIARGISRLAEEFKASQKVMTALGDEMRQHLILIMMQSGECTGLRVGEIAEKTRLSRPAVSHHLQILKDAGIVKKRREATRNYYYFDADMEAFNQLIGMLQHAKEIMLSLPDRSGEKDGYNHPTKERNEKTWKLWNS